MNVKYLPSFSENFIINLADDYAYKDLRKLSKKYGVPSLEEAACLAVKNISSIKQPKKSLDIGCGIGVSTLAILEGCSNTIHTAIDGNLERILIFNEYFKNYSNVTSYQIRGEQWLATCEEKYDLVFVDSVKREYSNIWHRLKKCLNSNATVIFDDILLYGYVTCVEAEVPAKYRENRLYMINFLKEIFYDKSLNSQIIPVSGGLLVISLK